MAWRGCRLPAIVSRLHVRPAGVGWRPQEGLCMGRLRLCLALALAAAAAACGGDGSGSGIADECNPLGGTTCMMPWPSAAYQVADTSTATGYRLAIPAEA